jgi:hypothetical protein
MARPFFDLSDLILGGLFPNRSISEPLPSLLVSGGQVKAYMPDKLADVNHGRKGKLPDVLFFQTGLLYDFMQKNPVVYLR